MLVIITITNQIFIMLDLNVISSVCREIIQKVSVFWLK
jgi:hypothetical protein